MSENNEYAPTGTEPPDPTRSAMPTASTNRRALLKAAGGAVAAAALAGCAQVISGGSGDENPADGANSADSLSDEPLDAMLLTFRQGAAGVLGVQAQRGAELAVQRICDAGGIDGKRKVNLTVKDVAENALSKYRASIDQGVDVTVGPISSGTYESLASEVVHVSTDGSFRAFSVSTGSVKPQLVLDQIADTAENPGISERDVVEEVMLGQARLKEMMEPIEVGNLFAFAFSEHGTLLNGADLLWDGGYTHTCM